jgi:citrate synthase
MEGFKKKYEALGLRQREESLRLRKQHADFVMGEYNLGQVFTGMKGIKGLPYETSALDPEEGIRYRGMDLPTVREKLPKAEGGEEPLPEGVFYLLLMGEVPSKEDVDQISNIWNKHSNVPKHFFAALDALPVETHPMAQFAAAINAMQTESRFAKAYGEGVNRTDLWSYMFDDVMSLLGGLPRIAAYIYRRTYHNNTQIEPDHSLDWSANFAHMMGFDDPTFYELMRLYMSIHADHEGGNVSAHTTRLVGSALSDAFFSFAAAMNGLAGPLHGLANQEVIKWIMEMREQLQTDLPTREQIDKYIRDTLDAGRVVPGYGHAVLRKTDPRFMAQREFALKHMPKDELVQIVSMLYEIVPGILNETGKIKNPYPNVDAHSGALLVHFGLKEYQFYTVLFGVSRALGVLSSLIWDRMLLLPIERPKSITHEAIKAMVGEKTEA